MIVDFQFRNMKRVANATTITDEKKAENWMLKRAEIFRVYRNIEEFIIITIMIVKCSRQSLSVYT